MTRKDFILIANALVSTRPVCVTAEEFYVTAEEFTYAVKYAQWSATVTHMADELEKSNDRFDRDRFVEWAKTKEVA